MKDQPWHRNEMRQTGADVEKSSGMHAHRNCFDCETAVRFASVMSAQRHLHRASAVVLSVCNVAYRAQKRSLSGWRRRRRLEGIVERGCPGYRGGVEVVAKDARRLLDMNEFLRCAFR